MNRSASKALRPETPPRQKKDASILLAVVGTSPAILTETVWALAKKGTAPIIPDEVVAITTTKGQKAIIDQLQTPSADFNGSSAWQALRRELLGAKATASSLLTLKVALIDRADMATGSAQPLEDIRNQEENLCAAEFILRQVRQYTNAKDRQLIASLAGGRKTMGALLHAAFTHLGRPQDRLTHILVNEPFDDPRLKPLFFYPNQPKQTLIARDGSPHEAKSAQIELADVPFAPLRVRFPDIADIPTRFRDLVQVYSDTFMRDASKPAVIELLSDPPRVSVDGISVEMESDRHLCVIRFLLEANQKEWLQKNQDEAAEIFKAWHGCAADEKRIRPALRDAIKRLYEERKSSPGEEWIRIASSDTIKRPLSALRRALEKAGASWKPPTRDLRLPLFRLVGEG